MRQKEGKKEYLAQRSIYRTVIHWCTANLSTAIATTNYKISLKNENNKNNQWNSYKKAPENENLYNIDICIWKSYFLRI